MFRLNWVVVTLCLLSGVSAHAQDLDYLLSFSDPEGLHGETRVVTCRLDFPTAPAGLSGWSFGVCHDEALIDPVAAAPGITTLHVDWGTPPDFQQINVIPNGTQSAGFDPGVNQSVVISFVGDSPLPVGFGYELLEIAYGFVATSGTAQIEYCDTTQGVVSAISVSLIPQGGGFSITPFQVGVGIPITPVIPFVRGDCNADGASDASDALWLVQYLFTGGATPTCRDACDTDDNGELGVTDAVFLLYSLFVGGTPLPPPATCAGDPTHDGLDCFDSLACP